MAHTIQQAAPMWSSVFCDIKRRSLFKMTDDLEEHFVSIFRWQAVLATCFKLVSSFVYSSTLKMEAICSYEMSVEFKRTTRRYRILHITGVRTSNPTCSYEKQRAEETWSASDCNGLDLYSTMVTIYTTWFSIKHSAFFTKRTYIFCMILVLNSKYFPKSNKRFLVIMDTHCMFRVGYEPNF
jgi:hypothetical protein